VAGYREKAVVIGAGISGLACAYRLRQLGVPCLVLEAKDRPGGLIGTIRRNGFLFELGPQCPRFPDSVWRLVRELNLENQFVAGDAKAKRYILRHGRLHAAPFSPAGLVTTRLAGFAAKFRILTEVFRSSHPPQHEENLAEFVRRKFGGEILDNLVDPVISTVFFGDAQKIGMESAFPALVKWEREYGSLVRGAIRARKNQAKPMMPDESPEEARPSAKRSGLRVTDSLPSLGNFRPGLATLPEKLAEELGGEIRYKAGIASVAQIQNGNGAAKTYREISLSSGEKITAAHLILAVPAYVAAELLGNIAPELASHLKSIEYAPMCAVASAYERSQVQNRLEGFGFMVPRREGLQTICTFWNSSLFPNRVPEGKVLITSFAGRGMGGGERDVQEEDAARVVEAENAKILGISGEPVDRVVWKDARALPQYNVGHAQRVAKIHDLLRALPNVYLAGNYLRGRSIGECVETAYGVAEDLHSRLRDKDI